MLAVFHLFLVPEMGAPQNSTCKQSWPIYSQHEPLDLLVLRTSSRHWTLPWTSGSARVPVLFRTYSDMICV